METRTLQPRLGLRFFYRWGRGPFYYLCDRCWFPARVVERGEALCFAHGRCTENPLENIGLDCIGTESSGRCLGSEVLSTLSKQLQHRLVRNYRAGSHGS